MMMPRKRGREREKERLEGQYSWSARFNLKF